MQNAPKFKPHPMSVPGDFYVEDGYCLACGVPHVVAPDLMGRTEGEYWHCFWKRQPETAEELDQAIAVLDAQELGCHRYAGNDPEILRRLPRECCDHFSPPPRISNWDFSKGGTVHFALTESGTNLMNRLWSRVFKKR